MITSGNGPSGELSSDRQFFSRATNWRYRLNFEVTRPVCTELVDGLLTKFLRPLLKNGLVDIKGRDPMAWPADSLTSETPRSEEELLLVGGNAFESTGKSSPRSALKPIPLRATIQSQFSHFDGTHHIVHELVERRGDTIPPWLDIYRLGRTLPIEVDLMRMGLDFFESKFSSLSFGYAPVVTHSLSIELTKTKGVVAFSADLGRGISPERLLEWEAFKPAVAVLERILKFDISGDLRARI